jgi:hypothetical protein
MVGTTILFLPQGKCLSSLGIIKKIESICFTGHLFYYNNLVCELMAFGDEFFFKFHHQIIGGVGRSFMKAYNFLAITQVLTQHPREGNYWHISKLFYQCSKHV